jgi:hypothetical protein
VVIYDRAGELFTFSLTRGRRQELNFGDAEAPF